jgi:hypothetical protein
MIRFNVIISVRSETSFHTVFSHHQSCVKLRYSPKHLASVQFTLSSSRKICRLTWEFNRMVNYNVWPLRNSM